MNSCWNTVLHSTELNLILLLHSGHSSTFLTLLPSLSWCNTSRYLLEFWFHYLLRSFVQPQYQRSFSTRFLKSHNYWDNRFFWYFWNRCVEWVVFWFGCWGEELASWSFWFRKFLVLRHTLDFYELKSWKWRVHYFYTCTHLTLLLFL